MFDCYTTVFGDWFVNDPHTQTTAKTALQSPKEQSFILLFLNRVGTFLNQTAH